MSLPPALRAGVFLLLAPFFACTQTLQHGRLGLIMPADSAPARSPEVNGPWVSGTACTLGVLGTTRGEDALEQAMHSALARAGPQYQTLVHVEVIPTGSMLALGDLVLVVRRCWTVRGMAATQQTMLALLPPVAPADPGPLPGPNPPDEPPPPPSAREYLEAALTTGTPFHPKVAEVYGRAVMLGALMAPWGAQLWAPRIFYGPAVDPEAGNQALALGLLGTAVPWALCGVPLLSLACLPSMVIPPVGLFLMALTLVGNLVGYAAFATVMEFIVIPRAVALLYSDDRRRWSEPELEPLAPDDAQDLGELPPGNPVVPPR